jgi:hypothetical protein
MGLHALEDHERPGGGTSHDHRHATFAWDMQPLDAVLAVRVGQTVRRGALRRAGVRQVPLTPHPLSHAEEEEEEEGEEVWECAPQGTASPVDDLA